MRFKKLLSAAMAFAVAVTLAATASAELVVVENPEPGLSSGTASWLVQLYNEGNEVENKLVTNYDIDYSKVAKYSATFTVTEEDREIWDGKVGGGLTMSINGGDIPMYETDENGNIIYETDENGNIIYETDENGDIVYETDYATDDFLLDENGEKIPKKKTHPLQEKYNWSTQNWWGVKDAALGIDTLDKEKAVITEKVGEYTYKITSNVYENPLANGDANEIGCMQICFSEWSGNITRLEVTNVDVMDSEDNVLISFDGKGKANIEKSEEPSASGALAVVEDPALPLVVTTPTMWYALGYSEGNMTNGETGEPYPALEFDIDYSKVAQFAATLTVVEEDRDIFDGQCAGGLTLSIAGGDIHVGNTELWNKYIWQGYEWWGVKDDALNIDTQAVKKDILAEKVGDYTYKLTTKLLDNPLANGDTQEIEHMMFAVQEWGDNKAKMKVMQLDVMDSSGNVLLSYNENGKATVPTASNPSTPSEPSRPSSPSTPSAPDDTTGSTADKTVEFVPVTGVDETIDEETAKVIAEIKVSAPEAAFEAGTALTVKKDDSVDGGNVFALDITFTLNGKAVQPKDGATVTVSVPVPPKFKDVNEDLLKVFHYLNGKYTRVEATVKNGVVTFDTTHFSTYVISPDDLAANNQPESSFVTPETSNPSTGFAAVSAIPVAALICAVAFIAKNKK